MRPSPECGATAALMGFSLSPKLSDKLGISINPQYH
jgi:hypothetical protein